MPDPLKDYPGWKTQFATNLSAGAYFAQEKRTDGPTFYGFGNCPQTDAVVQPKTFSNYEEALNFYQKVLRTDCFDYMKPLLELTLSSGLVTWANPHFEFVDGHEFL